MLSHFISGFRKSLADRRFDAEISALAFPALGALISDPLLSLVDTAFVGRLGAVPLAALGINTALFGLAVYIFNFLAYGTTPMVANAFGKGDRALAGRISMQALSLSLFIGLGALIVIQALAPLLITVMGAKDDVFDPTMSYLRIRALAVPAVLLITAANGVFRGFQNMRVPFWIMIGLNLVNVVLDALFIFGFGWGLQGAAWASVIAQYVGAASFVAILFAQRTAFQIPLLLPKLSEYASFLQIGWFGFLRTAALLFTFTLATAVATRVGTVEVAGHQVANNIWLLLALTVDALAIAAQALVGKMLGEGGGTEEGRGLARALCNRLLTLGFLVGIALAIVLTILSPWLPKLFSQDPEVIAVVYGVFAFVVLSQPLNAVVFVFDGIFMGYEDFAYIAVAMIVSAVAGCAVLLLVQPLNLGYVGVWWGLVVFMVVRFLTIGWRYFFRYEKLIA